MSELDVDSITLVELIFSIEHESDVEFSGEQRSEELFATTVPEALAKMSAGDATSWPQRSRPRATRPRSLHATLHLTLHLGQLLRLVTVETLARYVAHLRTLGVRASSGNAGP